MNEVNIVSNPTDKINADAEKWVGTLSIENTAQKTTEEIYDAETEEEIRYIRTPNFTDCGSANSQLPINVANEAITILSKYRSEFDFVDYIKEKLNYSSRVAVCMAFFSEQIDALILAIKQFESGKALILGDMAGLGKGRICAGLLRYAYQNKITPVFITEKENLFSDIYRDIINIGGFGSLSGGAIVYPKPFIMKHLSKEKVKDVDGNFVKDSKNRYVYRNINDIFDDDGNTLYTPLSAKNLNNLIEVIKNKEVDFKVLNNRAKDLDVDFNCVFLTYDVISKTRGESGNNKRSFLRNISPNSIIILDECHNASGKSKLGEECKVLITDAKGVLFSSATFAKNPQAFPLYIIKTSMAEAQIDITQIEKAIGVGGENVSEYISSVLVKEGQMIRRERDFSDCEISTIYDGSEKKGDEAIESKRKIYELFNKSTNIFKEIYDYIKTNDFRSAINQAIQRKLEELELDLAPQNEYEECKGNTKDKYQMQSDFINKYKNKYIIFSKDLNTIGANTKFHFTENILLSIKSKFTADAIIKELHSLVKYKNIDGKEKETNRKPVIALRATGETLFSKLNLKNGDTIKNDFSVYVRAVVSGIMDGKFVYRKIDKNLFIPKYVLEADDKKHEEEVCLYKIENEDLSDNGEKINGLLTDADNYNAGMPLCPIDYIIDRIESVQRASWDRFGNKAKPNFKVGEVTGRNFGLYKDKSTDMWVYRPNERDKNVKTAFNGFNNGSTDVLIINSSGSTGGSIHSSEKFKDQRQRIMFIVQIELNVNTEVQKRGRINRSGQLNFPAYLYVLSQIPSELRKLLSLKRKLRKLDANVSANQNQNSDIASIKDAKGNEIQDIFNIYGEEAFEKLRKDNDNDTIIEIYKTMIENIFNRIYSEEYASEGDVVKDELSPFTRELEIYPCELQEEFYDKMNMQYISVVNEHKANSTYRLELEIEDLKASLRSRIVRQMNSGNTEFSRPLFMEDKYCLQRKRVWSKEKLDSEIIKMATSFYKEREDYFVDITKFHRDLLEDFEVNYDSFVAYKISQKEDNKPKREDYSSDEDFNFDKTNYEESLANTIERFGNERTRIYELLKFFKPNLNVSFPDGVTGEGEYQIPSYKVGKFVGYIFKNTSKENKYSKGSIYFKFAFMDGVPSTEINISSDLEILQETRRNTGLYFSQTQADSAFRRSEKVNDWKVNSETRNTVRFLSGNILSGIQLANDMDDIKRWSLVKYTNSDGTISTSIRLDYYADKFKPMAYRGDEKIDTSKYPIQVSIDNQNIIQYLILTPNDAEPFKIGVNTFDSKNVEKADGAKDMIVKNLIRIGKVKGFNNKVYIELFQGLPDKSSKKFPITDRATKNNSDGNNPIFFAPFLKDYTADLERNYIKTVDAYFVYNSEFKNGLKAKSGFSKTYNFDNIDTEVGANKLTDFLNKIYEEQRLSIEFPQDINDYYNQTYKKDDYKTKSDNIKESQQVKSIDEGSYEYKLEVDYNERYKNNLPPYFKDYVKGKNTFDKGLVILSKPILPTFARTYDIYPINLSNEDTVKLLLSIFDEEERKQLIKNITDLVEKGEPISKIGDYVSVASRKRSVPDLKYIFGNRRTNDIGELLKTYAVNPEALNSLSYELVEETAEEIFRPKKKKDVITIEDAEKFINYLLF